MALDLANIHSLSDFQRNAKNHIRKLKQSGKPVVLTLYNQEGLSKAGLAAGPKTVNSEGGSKQTAEAGQNHS